MPTREEGREPVATSPARGAASSRPAPRDPEQDTRQQVLSTLLTRGPQTAAQVADELGLRAVGVRRHLDNLRYDGLVEKTDPPRVGSNPTAGRGRPAKAYRLTERGRAGFGDDYGSVAHRALELLDETAGRQAVCRLAEERIEEILAGVPRPSGESREELEETARAVARAFDRHGYAATVTFARAGSRSTSTTARSLGWPRPIPRCARPSTRRSPDARAAGFCRWPRSSRATACARRTSRSRCSRPAAPTRKTRAAGRARPARGRATPSMTCP